ncbi:MULTISPECIES: 4a-hydroxytetrahydrobiopterin dehydratase [unclassified Synechococcus]|uniref:4a-hydroxytetrahydrobiopterin dehydratase n=1 Tax=unclassified Synechococcus TaxID=2626047 RepID=UPI002AD47402|nr:MULTISPECIES: 4a-hydroxytetrahydrobiopterin dehydratase [unclassified Synechococcus]MEA5423435.1 4a-hydroxytetrahydrobiopterin dehydratase [Synechococcus sp. CCY9202]CAK6699627.1 Putative pterin-4-alpha-carbinolamine dehydratase [Synechococcus sp. CBW1107]
MALGDETCVPCRDGAPTLTPEECDAVLQELPGWEVVDAHHLRKAWTFPDFVSALAWVNQAGEICERQGHHAEFQLGWGHVEAEIFTHKVDSLTRADAVLAAHFDAAKEAADASMPQA